MAAELVGGALLSATFDVLLERLTPHVDFLNFIRRKKLDQNLLHRLKPTLIAARAVLNDAELKQITDSAVKEWLDELRDAVYEVEDLMDEVSTKSVTQNQVCHLSTGYLNVHDREMGNKLEAIADRLELLVSQKDVLGLRMNLPENLSWRPQSTSLVNIDGVYGRGKDQESIIEFLSDDNDKLSVISIVGMGGIGKTTLIQLIYNDNHVKQMFDVKAWACVSEAFDLSKITKTITEAIRPSGSNQTNLNLLQLDLKEKLSGKKFLVVLDDVWNANYTDWDTFMNPFCYGKEGSKIIVTTRSERVASMVKTIPSIYRLGLLSDDDCLSLFARHAFQSSDHASKSCLEKIGTEIASKCKGLPLAAKALGGLFRSNPNFRNWNSILKNDMWDSTENEIIPVLKVSYHYLPPQLKQCFVFCSLFPKDYEFDKKNLTLMWMAEGFLQPSERGMSLEEVGYEYFDELTSRSFFQPSCKNDGHFVMHDLIHDLATYIAGDFYIRLEKDGKKVSNMTHHLSYNILSYQHEDHFDQFSGRARALRLRTFLGFNYGKIPYSVRHDSLSFNLTYLRVLSFADFEVLKKVPDCIGEFIHLRYLDLSSTQIESLPNSLCNLYNLQTLKLHSCFLLMMLPNDMQNLVNLRYLDIQDTALEEMPKGLSKLQDLHFLSDFIVGKDHGTMIGELGEISNLRDKLKVRNLENIRNGKEAYEAKMMEKKHLKELYLSWSTSQNDIENSQTERDILDKLQPHWDLQVLHIDGYRGTTFPDWLGIHLYLNMTELKLDNCINCWMLPPLGQLHSLKRLHISQFPKVVTVGVEFFKGSDNCSLLTPFASLEYLEFFEMPTWKEWHSNEIEAFPKLQELHMNYCLQLTGDLPTHLPSLKILHITSCPVLTSSIPNYPKLQDLKILSCIGSLLSTMALWFHILHLQSDEEQAEREMNTLAISNSVLLSNAHLENLEKIQIEGCKDLKCLSNHANHLLPNLKKLSITGCPDFEPFLEGSLPSSLRELEISYCDKLLDRYMEWHLPNLTHLCISSKHDSIKCFPEEGFLPVTLITLELFGLTSLETLNCKGLHHLTSLQELSICVSPKLKKMEGGQVQLPASLKRLRLKKCGLLEERCYAKDAEIWPKICHIPVIEINYKFPHETLLEELAEESSQEEEFQA